MKGEHRLRAWLQDHPMSTATEAADALHFSAQHISQQLLGWEYNNLAAPHGKRPRRWALTGPVFLARFGRVGRNHNVPPLTVNGTAEQIAAQVCGYVAFSRFLGSRDWYVDVVLNADGASGGKGRIIVGMIRPGGDFTLEAL